MALAIGCVAAHSCHDDTFDIYLPEEGYGLDVTFTVDMPPLAATQLSSRGSAGNIIKEVNTLHIYVYNEDGTRLIYHCGKDQLADFKYDKNGNTKHPDYPYKDEVGNDKEYTGTSAGETSTPRATFKFQTSPFVAGETYQIYVTANVDVPASSYETADKLKAYTVNWNTTNTGANAQMMGMFAESDQNVEGERVTMNSSRTYNLHAWLVRCASKVTIDFNTTQLNDNVWIYLHSVTIRNIPKQCHLGDGNRATEAYGVHDKGDCIMYAPQGSDYANAENEFSNWPVLAKGTGKYGSDHSETAEALFFYENLQGTGKDKSQVDSDKTDTPEGSVSWPNGNDKDDYGWRDGKEYGTYIEVEAYYRSTVKGNEGRGTIKYRFMLGMDTFKDYNAYRNHHFKLTLNFRGNANDVDWHIDYKPQTDNPIYVPHPFYISYLYGESVEIPITVDGKLTPGSKIVAEIVENNWKPKDAPTTMYWAGDVQSGQNQQFDGPWHGFLSLRPTNSQTNVKPGTEINNADVIGRENTLSDIAGAARPYLMSYWYGGYENMSITDNNIQSGLFSSEELKQNEDMFIPPQGYREYETTIRDGRTYENMEDNKDSFEILQVENGGKIKTHMYLPLYTRALFMVKTLGYSGANPYFNYQRKAVVKITCWVDEKGADNVTRSVKYTKLCDVIQVRRIINPTGIYREAGNNKSFSVTLAFRTAEKAASFMPFASEGKWSAEIEAGDPGFITLNGLQRVQGKTGEYVKFQVHFIPTMAKKNRYAVILVKYHDYTCKHRIMVRQGYEPDALIDGGVKWHCFNLRGGNREGDSPIEAGSQFRFGNLFYAIDARANNSSQFGNDPGTKEFDVVDKNGNLAGKQRWWVNNQSLPGLSETDPNLCFQICTNLNASTVNFRRYFKLVDKDGNEIPSSARTRLPMYDDWKALRDNDHVFYSFGICYDGNTTSTSMSADKAFNYLYTNPDKEGCGMRGIFLVNMENGKNFQLPVGASGYGRRKSGGKVYASFDQPGTLRYANRSAYMAPGAAKLMPPFWNIKDNLGAIYWGYPDATERTDVWNSKPVSGFTAWDINVSTYDFNHFSSNAYNSDDADNYNAGQRNGNAGRYYFSDSAFLRLVDEP